MTDNIVLEHLRAIRSDLSEIKEDIRDVKHRLTSVEMAVSQVHGDFAGQSLRIDRIQDRLHRIETRINLSDA